MTLSFSIKAIVAVTLLLSVSACGMFGGDRTDITGVTGVDKLWVPRNDKSLLTDQGKSSVDEVTSYTVVSGDDLHAIASRLTGSGANWQVIAEHNQMDNPNSLTVGDVLILPQSLLLQKDTALDATSIATQSTRKYDLFGALASAQDYDAVFKAAISSNEIVQSDLPIARSVLLPQASAGYVAGYYDFSSDSSDEYGGQQLSLSLSQSLYDRANAIAVRQARLSGSLADVQLHSDHEDLLIRVATNYFNVLKAQAELRYRQSDLDAIRQQLLQTRRRYEVGSIANTDVVEAQAQYDLAVATEISANDQLATTLEALEVNTGLPMTGELASLTQSIPLESPDPEDINAWVQTAMANNKLLLVARDRTVIAQQQVKQTRASRLPTVDLTGFLSGVDSDNDVSEDISAGSSSGGFVQLGIEVPVLTGGLISAQVAQEKSRTRLASEQLQSIERETVQTTRDTYRGVVAGVSRVKALRQALRSTGRAAEATQAGFDQGTRTSVEVLQSLRDTFSAQSDYAAARYDYILDLLQLKRASGTLELADVQRVNGWLE